MRRTLLLLLPILLGSTLMAMAQMTGTLSGHVVDIHDRPVIGAVIRIEETGQTAVSRAPDGRFLIAGAPVGVCAVKVTAEECHATIQTTRICGDETTLLDLRVYPGAASRTVVRPGPAGVLHHDRAGTVRGTSDDGVDAAAGARLHGNMNTGEDTPLRNVRGPW